MATTTNNGWITPDDTNLVKNGASDIRTLANAIDTSVGTGLLAWQTYTPTLSGGWTAGTGSFDARYVKIGKFVAVSFAFTVGNGNKGTNFTFSLPVTARVTLQGFNNALCTRGAGYYGSCAVQTSTTANIVLLNSASTYLNGDLINATTPGTWTTGDTLKTTFIYEAA